MSRDSVVLGQCCFEVTKQWIAPGLTETLCTQEPVPTLVPEYKVLDYGNAAFKELSWLFTSFCFKCQLRVVVRCETRITLNYL